MKLCEISPIPPHLLPAFLSVVMPNASIHVNMCRSGAHGEVMADWRGRRLFIAELTEYEHVSAVAEAVLQYLPSEARSRAARSFADLENRMRDASTHVERMPIHSGNIASAIKALGEGDDMRGLIDVLSAMGMMLDYNARFSPRSQITALSYNPDENCFYAQGQAMGTVRVSRAGRGWRKPQPAEA